MTEERGQAEAALRESEQLFRQIIENIAEVIWLSTPNKNKMLYISPAYEKIWGRTCESLYTEPRSWLDAIHPEDRDRVRLAALTKQSQGDYEEEYRITRPDASVRWIRDRAFPVKDASGNVYRIAGIAEDVTLRVMAEKKFRALLEFSPDGIVVIDEKGKVVLTNLHAEQIFGYKREELIGRAVETLMPERFRARHVGLRQSYVADPKSRPMGTGLGLYALRKDGSEFPADISVSPVLTPEGLLVMSSIRDLTERKAMEDRILQSEKLSVVGQMMAGVSHEINNPMGIILGFAQSLASRVKDDDPLSLPIKSIEREALRCQKLLQGLLVFSRVSNPEKMETGNCQQAIGSALSLVEAQLRIHDVTLVKEITGESTVLANMTQLQQVVINLCNNAIDAMPKGGTLTVSTRNARRDGKDWLELAVADTGTGIPEEIRSKIFNPFFTTKGAGKGTGLGLSLVGEIIERHRGTIECTSEVGKGTTFKAYLPLANADPAAQS
jgi:PAS domain S-box-containing protein